MTSEQPSSRKESAMQNVMTMPKTLRGRMSQQIALNMFLICVSVHAPSGESKIKNARILRTNADGQEEEVKKEKATTPRHKYMSHEIWKKLKKNGEAIYNTLDIYSALSPSDGMRQIPGSKLLDCTKAIDGMIQNRKALIVEYKAVLPELIAGIYIDFPDEEDRKRILSLIPSAEQADDRFRVDVTIWPLTPLKGEQLAENIEEFQHLSQDEQRRFIATVNTQVDKLAKEQAKRLVDDVIGGMLKQIREIASGTVLTGHNKDGVFNPILHALDKLTSFEHVIDDKELLEQIRTAKARLRSRNNDASALNRHSSIRTTIQKEMQDLDAKLTAAMKNIDVGSGRVERAIE